MLPAVDAAAGVGAIDAGVGLPNTSPVTIEPLIRNKYLIVVMIPCYTDSGGNRPVDPLWHKDLVKHLAYIEDLTLASPVRGEPPDATFQSIEPGTTRGKISYLDLPPCLSTLSELVSLPAALAKLWKAVGAAEIVHLGVAGWPIPYGWFVAPMAKLRGKFVINVIESAPWRADWGRTRNPKVLLKTAVFEAAARFCVNISDLVIFTHAGYRDTMLLKRRRHRGHVHCASWIDASVVLPPEEAETSWAEKLADKSRPLRVVFAGRLQPAKGLQVLLDALPILDRRGSALEVMIYGEGPLRESCETAARLLTGAVSLKLGGTLAYGPEFFDMLRCQDVLVAPTVSDEQPRIVYDAFSQAVPVIASNTPGMKECVADGRNGLVVPVEDALALADAISWASDHREDLKRLGTEGLIDATKMTHETMHSLRAALIESMTRGK